MLKFILAFMLITHVVFCEEDDEEKKRVDSLRIINGTCHYRGEEVEGGDYEVFRDPCEKWECNLKEMKLIITGCKLPDQYGSCIPYSTGRSWWPHCCNYRHAC
uniref:Single domain-containing protein n=1 Tax=Amblyomma americanum TaxID=6943 RepID=A0A0C9SEN2_AMBAM